MKNLNSFANVERALEAERERQIGLLERGDRVAQVTLLFNAGTGQVQAAPLQGGEPRLPLLPRSGPAAAGPRDRPGSRSSARAARAARGPPQRAWRWHYGLPAYDARVLTSEVRAGATTSSQWSRRGSRAQDRRQLGHGRRDDHLQRDRARSRSPAERLAALVASGADGHGEPPGRETGLCRAGAAAGRQTRRPWRNDSGWSR